MHVCNTYSMSCMYTSPCMHSGLEMALLVARILFAFIIMGQHVIICQTCHIFLQALLSIQCFLYMHFMLSFVFLSCHAFHVQQRQMGGWSGCCCRSLSFCATGVCSSPAAPQQHQRQHPYIWDERQLILVLFISCHWSRESPSIAVASCLLFTVSLAVGGILGAGYADVASVSVVGMHGICIGLAG